MSCGSHAWSKQIDLPKLGAEVTTERTKTMKTVSIIVVALLIGLLPRAGH